MVLSLFFSCCSCCFFIAGDGVVAATVSVAVVAIVVAVAIAAVGGVVLSVHVHVESTIIRHAGRITSYRLDFSPSMTVTDNVAIV